MWAVCRKTLQSGKTQTAELSACRLERKRGRIRRGEYWEIIVTKIIKAGFSVGWVSAVDSEGRTIWIVDAHRDNGKRFVVRSDEILTAFLELERITHELAVAALLNDS